MTERDEQAALDTLRDFDYGQLPMPPDEVVISPSVDTDLRPSGP